MSAFSFTKREVMCRFTQAGPVSVPLKSNSSIEIRVNGEDENARRLGNRMGAFKRDSMFCLVAGVTTLVVAIPLCILAVQSDDLSQNVKIGIVAGCGLTWLGAIGCGLATGAAFILGRRSKSLEEQEIGTSDHLLVQDVRLTDPNQQSIELSVLSSSGEPSETAVHSTIKETVK
jgi:hypothetical protein